MTWYFWMRLITAVVMAGLVEIASFLREEKPRWLHVILTGRDAAAEVIDVANTVTEMKMIKHAYAEGIMAEQGIEF